MAIGPKLQVTVHTKGDADERRSAKTQTNSRYSGTDDHQARQPPSNFKTCALRPHYLRSLAIDTKRALRERNRTVPPRWEPASHRDGTEGNPCP
jgi:hypothetical protein